MWALEKIYAASIAASLLLATMGAARFRRRGRAAGNKTSGCHLRRFGKARLPGLRARRRSQRKNHLRKGLRPREHRRKRFDHSTQCLDIGSTSKQFTASSILLLEKQGKLSVNDDVRKFIPELPDYGHKITILHLLNHTSGLRDYLALFELAGVNIDSVTTDEDALAVIARQKIAQL